LRTFTKRIGRTDLSLLAADRAVLAAETADDPVRIAAAKWNLGQILLAQGDADGAEEVTIRAVEDLDRELAGDMRYNTLARDLVHGLLKRARPTYAPQVRALAERINLLN
jgi:hypothetical protein